MSTIELQNMLRVMDEKITPLAKQKLVGPLSDLALDVRDLFANLRGILTVTDGGHNAIHSAAMEPGRTHDYTLSKKMGIFNAAKKIATERMDQAKADSLALKANLEAAALPARPAGATDLAVYDCKQDIADLLKVEPSPIDAYMKAIELARTAVTETDLLTSFVLGVGLLKFVFARLLPDKAAELQVELRKITASGPAAEILRLWEGPDGIANATMLADHILFGELDDMEAIARQ
jgi:hypothetical protein